MDENKTYDFKGTVTISTEEYRDIVWNSATNKVNADDYRSRWWSEKDKVKKLEAQLKEADDKISKLLDLLGAEKAEVDADA